MKNILQVSNKASFVVTLLGISTFLFFLEFTYNLTGTLKNLLAPDDRVIIQAVCIFVVLACILIKDTIEKKRAGGISGCHR